MNGSHDWYRHELTMPRCEVVNKAKVALSHRMLACLLLAIQQPHLRDTLMDQLLALLDKARVILHFPQGFW